MPINDLLPWRKDRPTAIEPGNNEDFFLNVQDRMNRMFDDFFTYPFHSYGLRNLNNSSDVFYPRVDVSETDKEYKVVAEIPGIDEKDINVTLNDDVLTISGKKEFEKEESGRQYHRVERTYGSFRRDVQLPGEVIPDQIEATFKKGVLEIVLPKPAEQVNKGRKITIKAE
jgi:HSP20 family protein